LHIISNANTLLDFERYIGLRFFCSNDQYFALRCRCIIGDSAKLVVIKEIWNF